MKEMPKIFTQAVDGIKFNSDKLMTTFNSYISSNRPVLEIICVYAFWLVSAKWLKEYIGFTKEFVGKLREQFNKCMLHIYWIYLNPLRIKDRDALMDLNLIFIAEVVRAVFSDKIKNHMIKLHH